MNRNIGVDLRIKINKNEIATMLGLRGWNALVVSSSFFSFLENLRLFSFIFFFYVSCWFKWIEMDKSFDLL